MPTRSPTLPDIQLDPPSDEVLDALAAELLAAYDNPIEALDLLDLLDWPTLQ